MKATIKRFERDAEIEEEQAGGGMFGNKKQMVKVKKHQIGVSLVIELTEEEKAIIELYGLKELIVEDEPAFTAARLAELHNKTVEQLSRKDKQSDWAPNHVQEMDKVYAAQRRQVKFGEYLKAPYERFEDTLYKAAQTYDLLKNQVLPTIAGVISTTKSRPVTETFEF